jgi:alpha-mannosidase
VTLPLTIVPHTHWDREWYLPLEEFRARLVPVLDEVLDLLDRGYPHFHLDGQTAPIDDYLEVRPERESELRRHAASGRLAVGPWLTLVDEFLVSGETIVRDLELGLARARELGAPAPFVGYLPDQFGHIGQMPQLLREAGIDTAVVWRGVPGEIDRSVFRWEAPDGSEVLAEYLPFGYSLGMGLRDAEEPHALALALAEIGRELEPFAARERLLVPAGSDHAPPDPTLPERLDAAARADPGLQAEIGPLAGYVAQPLSGEVPLWQGELRSAARAHLLPGVVSTRIHQKQARAEAEALLERYAEPLATLVPGLPWPEGELERAWRLLILNGAHDSVCGCSADEVAHAVDSRSSAARALAEEVTDSALARLAEQVDGDGVLCFNPSTFEREGVPGLGWRIGRPPEPEEVALEVNGARILVCGLELTLEDEADAGDLYNFAPGGPRETIGRLTSGNGRLEARSEGLTVRLRARRGREEPYTRLEVRILNERPDHRLRLRLRLPRPATSSVAVSPFELVRRPLTGEGSALEEPSATWPARGAVLAGSVAVLAKGVFEYELTGRDLAVTLLRCVGTISRPHLSTRPAAAGPDVATPEAQLLGETNLSFALYPNATVDGLLPAWERFAIPLRSTPVSGRGQLPHTGTLLDVGGAQLSSIRRREGELEARLWNPTAATVRARVGTRALDLGPRRIGTLVV